MTRQRVINLGLPKTGTTTLGKALRRAGYSVADWRVRDRQTKHPELRKKMVGELIYKGCFETGDPLHLLDEFDAVTEMSVVRPGRNFWPQTDWSILGAIEEHHPGAVFLLSVRDPSKTSDSMMRWGNLGSKRLPAQHVPGLPRGYGATTSDLERWIDGHYRFCRRVFAGSDRFFEYDIEDPDARIRIGAFLGRDLPWWGQSNRNTGATPKELTATN